VPVRCQLPQAPRVGVGWAQRQATSRGGDLLPRPGKVAGAGGPGWFTLTRVTLRVVRRALHSGSKHPVFAMERTGQAAVCWRTQNMQGPDPGGDLARDALR